MGAMSTARVTSTLARCLSHASELCLMLNATLAASLPLFLTAPLSIAHCASFSGTSSQAGNLSALLGDHKANPEGNPAADVFVDAHSPSFDCPEADEIPPLLGLPQATSQTPQEGSQQGGYSLLISTPSLIESHFRLFVLSWSIWPDCSNQIKISHSR